MARQESVRCQEVSEAHVEGLRRAVELYTGECDSARDDTRVDEYTLVGIADDICMNHEWSIHEAAFLSPKVDDARKPIIDRFGRFSYWNAVEGRMNTEQELEWIGSLGHSVEAPPGVAERVKGDIEAERWTPLEEGTDAGGSGDVLIAVIDSRGEDLSSETSLQITIRLGDPGREIVEWLP